MKYNLARVSVMDLKFLQNVYQRSMFLVVKMQNVLVPNCYNTYISTILRFKVCLI